LFKDIGEEQTEYSEDKMDKYQDPNKAFYFYEEVCNNYKRQWHKNIIEIKQP
jgi:hypothetical protein